MSDFIIEKDVPREDKRYLPEFAKNLVEKLEIDQSFTFPVRYYAALNSYKQRYSAKTKRKFSISYIENNKGRIWRIL